jgi:excalibur calcium-binding domain-containing protein
VCYPFFKPNPRPRPKLPLQLNPNLRSRGSAKIAALAAIVAFAVVWGLGSSPWPVMTTLRHIASAPNCGFARLVGLAPARRGQPGYWKRHDRDGDGIACEPWLPRVSNRF